MQMLENMQSTRDRDETSQVGLETQPRQMECPTPTTKMERWNHDVQ